MWQYIPLFGAMTLRLTTLKFMAELHLCFTECRLFFYCFTEYRYAECHYAEYRYAECHYAECHYAECHLC